MIDKIISPFLYLALVLVEKIQTFLYRHLLKQNVFLFYPFDGQIQRRKMFQDLVTVFVPTTYIEVGVGHGLTSKHISDLTSATIQGCLPPKSFNRFAKYRYRRIKNATLSNEDPITFLNHLNATIGQGQTLYYLSMESDFLIQALSIIKNHSDWDSVLILVDRFQVPHDAGYSHENTDYAKTLDFHYLYPFVPDELDVFFPVSRSDQETGPKNGYAVLAKKNSPLSQLIEHKVASLRKHDITVEDVSLARREPILHIFGDSHSVFSFGKTPQSLIHHLGAITMYRVGRDNVNLINLAQWNVRPSDIVAFCFGEIDVRSHIMREVEEKGRVITDVIEDLAKKYLEGIYKITHSAPCAGTIILGVVPASTHRDIPEYPIFGNVNDRVKAEQSLNSRLTELSAHMGFVYFNEYQDYRLSNGRLNPALSDGFVHVAKDASSPLATKLYCLFNSMTAKPEFSDPDQSLPMNS